MTHFDDEIEAESQLLADLRSQAAELERRLSDAQASLEREADHVADGWVPAPRYAEETYCCHEHAAGCREADGAVGSVAGREPAPDPSPGSTGEATPADERTQALVTHGRRSARYPHVRRRHTLAAGMAALAILVAVVLMMELRPAASWPASVKKVQREVTTACHNPDVKSEPGQINFACAKSTRQILWVFALMTSGNDAHFADTTTGRLGLEPISPAQGSEVAWSLNLHHPYRPYDALDSIEVAARAINNIIGGATLTGADGTPVVQPGLEGHASNCARYTGSADIITRKGFPRVCARPVTSRAGRAALVADVYRKWVPGATSRAAHQAAVLFENATNPGNPQVQAILDQVLHRKRPA